MRLAPTSKTRVTSAMLPKVARLKRRNRRGHSQEVTAAKLEVSRPAVIRWERPEETFLPVALLSTKAQANFAENLNLVSSIAIDFDHLRCAGRIRYSGINENEDGVVHFVARRSEELSDYSREFLGCEPVLDSAAQAKLLYMALSKLAEKEGMSRENKEKMMHQTHSYWDDFARPTAL